LPVKTYIMEKYISNRILTVSFLLATCGVLRAQNAQPINVITTSVPFLRISPDARAGGMGDVGIAVSPDVNSVFWNIGKMPFSKVKSAVAANYSPWLRNETNDMYLASVGGYYKPDGVQAIYGSVKYFSLGDIQFTDNNGSKLNSYHPKEFCISGGYSRKLDRFGVGLGLKYIHSNLASDGTNSEHYKPGTAVAADLGFYYDATKQSGNGWSFGVALSNLGSKIAYVEDATQEEFIPANLGIGTAYSHHFNAENKIQFGLDINKLLVPTPPAANDSAGMANYRNKGVVSSWFSSFGDAPGGFNEELKEFQISVGGEYWYNNQFALRTGYFYEGKTKGNRRYLTMGAGVRYNQLGLDFSYLVPSGGDRNPLANTLRFGLVLDLK
jgi:hypothetical protein